MRVSMRFSFSKLSDDPICFRCVIVINFNYVFNDLNRRCLDLINTGTSIEINFQSRALENYVINRAIIKSLLSNMNFVTNFDF